MREIKFRGRHIETGEWIYGNLIGNDVIVGEIVEWDSEYFNTEFWYKVDPKTVGQYTGLQDRHGNHIYDGDILRDDEMGLNVVKWENGSYWIQVYFESGNTYMEHLSDYNEVCEIFGNIYFSLSRYYNGVWTAMVTTMKTVTFGNVEVINDAVKAEANNAPEAVCKAILKAVCVEIEE